MPAFTCPACNKSGITVEICPRCGCDLARLHEINRAALMQLRRAATCLKEQDWKTALRHASVSWRMRHNIQAAQIAFLASGALGMAEQLLVWQERIKLQSADGAESRK
jgi:hypothetical protein